MKSTKPALPHVPGHVWLRVACIPPLATCPLVYAPADGSLWWAFPAGVYAWFMLQTIAAPRQLELPLSA